MPEFRHGINASVQETVNVPVKVVPAGVIALIGTVPVHHLAADNVKVNELVLIGSDTDARKYGGWMEAGKDYTIPEALSILYRMRKDYPIIMLNVLDRDIHKTAVVDESVAFDEDGILTLAHTGPMDAVVKHTSGAPTYVKDEDYSVDARTGTITRIETGDISAEATVKVSYDYVDPTLVESSDIIGSVDVEGKRTGLQKLRECYSKLGFNPKHIIVPGFDQSEEVAAEIASIHADLFSEAYITAPLGTTRAQMIDGRGADGTINFNYSQDGLYLCGPHASVYFPDIEDRKLTPLATIVAGVAASLCIDGNYAESFSNKDVPLVLDSELDLSFDYTSSTCDANLLNAAGIVTMGHDFGRGWFVWGNRGCSFPVSTNPTTMNGASRMGRIWRETLLRMYATIIDKKMINFWLNRIVAIGTNLLNEFVSNGNLLGGKVWLDEDRNLISELAFGHLTVSTETTTPPAIEHIQIEHEETIKYLNTLKLGGN